MSPSAQTTTPFWTTAGTEQWFAPPRYPLPWGSAFVPFRGRLRFFLERARTCSNDQAVTAVATMSGIRITSASKTYSVDPIVFQPRHVPTVMPRSYQAARLGIAACASSAQQTRTRAALPGYEALAWRRLLFNGRRRCGSLPRGIEAQSTALMTSGRWLSRSSAASRQLCLEFGGGPSDPDQGRGKRRPDGGGTGRQRSCDGTTAQPRRGPRRWVPNGGRDTSKPASGRRFTRSPTASGSGGNALPRPGIARLRRRR
jgi:hypothetical protein